ncbi:universal stress protein [uncultured Roseivirga sp.]|uniref:universal stress protein n=1 Tax=uncultured Roseivirga sp. TaxID=543088 RepID=UPI0030D9B33A|tara:strand:- start:117931 stop:118854 length:924 start_codon:yes stop_codon:yes gene_type:complete
MPKREKILVLMDTSDVDKTLLRFIEIIATAHETKEIHFFNSISEMKIPEAVLKNFPEIKDKSIEERRKMIQNLVSSTLPEKLVAISEVHIKEGSPAKAILKFVEKHDIDLIMMGRHKDFVGGGILSNRLARRADCAIFIIPENSGSNLNLIHVPCDFSVHSKIAMEEAIGISRKYDSDIKIICQNVFTVPGGYHYSGKTYEEFAEVMRANAEKDYNKFMSEIDHEGCDIEVVYSLDTNDNPVNDIIDFANEHKPTTIIIGVKGRTATTALFIGSRAEQLIQINNNIPMMIVRPKGKNAGLMDLIREI